MDSQIPPGIEAYLASMATEQLAALAAHIVQVQVSRNAKMAEASTKPKTQKNKNDGASHAKGTKASVIPPIVNRAAKRPLNSFIAFRSYYKGAFVSLQQKDISGYLHQLWLVDHCKNKWAIIAKAYSIIRDNVGKANAPLSEFFTIAVDYMGVIPADQYFTVMGWKNPNGNGPDMIRTHVVDAMTLPEHFSVTTLTSVDDLVKHCTEVCHYGGSVQAGGAKMDIEGTMSMAVGNSADTTVEDISAINIIGNNNFVFGDSTAYIDAPAANDPSSIMYNDKVVECDCKSTSGFCIHHFFDPNDSLLHQSGDSYPFIAQFDPADAAKGVGLNFDPYAGNEFDLGGVDQMSCIPEGELLGEDLIHWEME